AFSPDGKQLVSGSEDRTACIWEVATGKALHRLSDHEGHVVSVAYTPDGSRIISSSLPAAFRVTENFDYHKLNPSDKTLRAWNAVSGKLISSMRAAFAYSATLSPDGARAFTGHDLRRLVCWELASGQHRELNPVHVGPISALACSSVCDMVLSASA